MGLDDGNIPNNTNTSNIPNKYQYPVGAVAAAPSEEPMDILRCAPMTLLQLYIPAEAAQAPVAELGSLGLVQFRDVSLVFVEGFCFIPCTM